MRTAVVAVHVTEMLLSRMLTKLEKALQRLQTSACPTLPVLRNQKLVGLLTAENLGEFLMIQGARSRRKLLVPVVGQATV